MSNLSKNQSILVVSNTPELAEITRNAMEGTVIIYRAANESEARDKIRINRPKMIILGYLDPPDEVYKFYRELREGWISRHSALVVVELNTSAGRYRILNDENLEVGAGEYHFSTGASSPLIPSDYFLSRLREKITAKLREGTNELKASLLNPQSFCLTWEQIPGMGAFEARQELVLENARKAAKGGQVCAISIVDNPGGNPAIATEILCSEIRRSGIEPIVHLAFRDKSRNQVESLLYQLAALDINNLLILTGDYPSNIGFQGKSRPVFDLDAVQGLQLVKEMNQGMEHEIMRRKTSLAPTDFWAGVAFSPFKQEESEVLGQYYKLQKKIAAGADFIITQIGYDVRKLHELKMWLQTHKYNTPVLTSIHVLSYTAARAMHSNRVPGAVVTDKLLSQIADEYTAPDKGRLARLDRAAKLYAISKGLGFKGACISGQGLPYENVEYIIEKGKELTPAWQDLVSEFEYPQKNGFYFFERENESVLNTNKVAARKQKPTRPLIFILSRILHTTVFEPRSPIFKMILPLMRFIDSSRLLSRMFDSLEYWVKVVLYGCMNCGDCALFDVAYLCPVSQCPKDQRNAPCGGSYEGWCEVYPGEKKCIWVRAYRRLKSIRKEDTIGDTIVPPCDWELWQTSSWLNYFMGRDHVSKRAGIKPPQKSPEPTGR
jgi:methylenetetrahydrofolate reductase (NADPH)